jgi:CRP/FNR family transcriptional regulator, cyclic AMP receptor protein
MLITNHRDTGDAVRLHSRQNPAATGAFVRRRPPADPQVTAMTSELPLFNDFSGDDLAIISAYGTPRTFAKGAIVVSEGDESDCFYIIQSGRTKVYASDESGHEVILNTQGPGEFFGELVLIDQAPRSASVSTLEKSVLIVVSQRNFERCLHEHPQLVFKLMRPLVRRVRALTRNVKNMALLDVYGRVANLLIEMSSEVDGGRMVDHRMTHQEIASSVGASREMVSRIMRDLEVGGYLKKSAGGLQIIKRLPKSW